ncbi:hypothetical protein FOZG_14976 [Fusarium oxysporum Fo47]|uniref:Uncharacterized protein n=1 Tax=Fusarium oxysporum Fo47 TaxID=660027 RepID=W9JN76_FUSOX|nr:hypothetical protein FOZG_14976 [Fusarium oxysporum Fo47]
MQPLARPQFALQPDRSSLWGTCFKTHSARPSTTGQFIVSKKATNYSRGALITSNALGLFFFINNAFRLLEEFSGAGGKSTAHPQPGCPPPLLFLSFATKIPGVHRGSICNIILSSLFSSSRFNCCVRLLHIVYGRIASTSTSSIGVDVYECVDWMDWTETV